MKILHTVELYYPSIGGMQEIVKQLSERLVRLGHKVTIATTKLPEREEKIINGVKIVEFNIKGKMVEGITGEVDEYKKFLLNSNFDIVTNFAAQQWATDLALPILDKITSKKVFVPQGFSSFYRPEYKKYFESLKIWMKKYDINVFTSYDYRDINFARKHGVRNIIMIPNGAGEDEFLAKDDTDIRKKLNIPRNYFLILHVGSHTRLKGHRETIEIFKKAKIKNATLLMIGNSFGYGCERYCFLQEKLFNFSPARLIDKKKLIISTQKRRETVSVYKEADLFLFPSNIECSPLVLFECMASKTPYLTSDCGNAEEIISWSQSGILLPTVKDSNGYARVNIDGSVKILEEIYADPLKRKKMEEAGFEAWKEKFTWEKIAEKYEKLYKKLLCDL